MTTLRDEISGRTEPFIGRLARNHSVYLLLAAYFAANLIVRLLQPNALETDEGQQIFLSQWLAGGYDNQPPFYTWLQYGVVQVFGASVFAVAILKNVMLFLCYLLFGMTVSLIVRNRVLAVVTTLALITVPQISFEMQRDLTHTVGVLFAASLFIYFLARTLLKPTAANFVMVGLAVGIGTIAKYNFVVLPIAVIISVWWDGAIRHRLFDRRILLSVLVAAVVVAPHAIWAINHISVTTDSHVAKFSFANGKTYLDTLLSSGLPSLAKVLATTTLPALAAFSIAFGGQLKDAWRAESMWTRLVGRVLVISAVFLLIIVLAGAGQLKGRWLVPYFFLWPLYLGLKLDAAFPDAATWETAARRFGAIVVAVMVLIPSFLFGRVALAGQLRSYQKLNVPYGPAVSQILATGKDRPALILVPTPDLAGNVRLQDDSIPVTAPNYDWNDGAEISPARPLLVVWRASAPSDTAIPGSVAAWLSERAMPAIDAKAVQTVAVPYHYARPGDVRYFAYAWLMPGV